MIEKFFADDDGAQVIEYALIIAVISIALVAALQSLPNGDPFGPLIERVTTCLAGTCG